MGIESDQLVFDYLSKVGDLAQQRQLPSGDRMRLVSDLRGEIERRRSKATAGDGPAAVKRILARLGTPDEVVTAAGGRPARPSDVPSGSGDETKDPTTPSGAGGPDGAARTTGAAQPPPTGTTAPGSPPATGPGTGRTPWSKSLRRMVPRPRAGEPSAPEPGDAGFPRSTGPRPPHLAGTDELGPAGSAPDWWRIDGEPLGGTDIVPGFTGGVEVPEILRPPPKQREQQSDEPGGDRSDGKDVDLTKAPAADAAAAQGGETAGPARRGLLRRLLRTLGPGRAPAGAGAAPAAAKRSARRWTNPLLLLAAVLLVAGAVTGNWFALGLGWVIAYASRRLTVAERKAAVLVLPGLAVAAGFLWLWGRQNDRWGEQIADGQMTDAVAGTWPWVVRGAALASAAFLVWRSQRRRP